MSLSPKQISVAFETLVDVMIPGDELFPSAAQVGTHLWVMDKIRTAHAPDTLQQIAEILGVNFDQADREQQIEAVRRFEQQHPALFGFVRAAIYFGYYQTPTVVDAVRSLGRAYNHSPQPDGYTLAAFDPTTLPAQPRGFYIPTDAVERVDLSGIDMHGLQPTWKPSS